MRRHPLPEHQIVRDPRSSHTVNVVFGLTLTFFLSVVMSDRAGANVHPSTGGIKDPWTLVPAVQLRSLSGLDLPLVEGHVGATVFDGPWWERFDWMLPTHEFSFFAEDDGWYDTDPRLALSVAWVLDQGLLAAGDDTIPKFPEADSTARTQFLPGRPRGGAVTSPLPSRLSPLYLAPSTGVTRTVTIDSTARMVTVREMVNGMDIRIPLRIPLDEYIRLRYDEEIARRTREQVAKTSQGGVKDLEGLLKNITELEIPIPPNPLMSIFGDRSRISLRISGAIDINAGFRIETSDQQSVFLRPTQFSPNFKQQVQVQVNGLIGDKLSIKADWSTERTFEYENQLKIKYTGYEDEIVQSVEAGNVSLQTPSTLMGGSGALFGIKAEFQLGPLRLTTVASQKKGESTRLSVSGGASESKFERHAYDYSDNHYFIDVAYRDPLTPGDFRNVYEAWYNYRDPLYGPSQVPVKLRPQLEIKDIEVWVTRPAVQGNIPDPDERDGVALIKDIEWYNPGDATFPASYTNLLDPRVTIDPLSGEREVGKFKKWKRDIDYSYNPITGILTLNQTLQEDQVVGVAYRVQGPTSIEADDQYYGTFSNDKRLKSYQDPVKNENQLPSRLVLKLVKPKNLGPSFKIAWRQKVRSIYSLNSRNLKKEDIANFKIVYRSGAQQDQEILPGTNVNLIKLFGLDYTDDNGGPPDNKIDFIPGQTVDPMRGEIIFPTLEPWNSGLEAMYMKLPGKKVEEITPYLYPMIYDTTKTIARQSDRDKIMIVGTTRGTSSQVYNLGFNVVRGSVRVLLNGQALRPGTDYTVDEDVGQVRILKEEALVAGAKVDIDYERQDLFSFASKTLVGMRGEMAAGKETFLGFTLLSLNQKTLSDKVRIGEEPISNTMFGMDVRTKLDLPLVTDALNMLPFIQTKAPTVLQMQGEFATIIPDPNTKLSTIPTDEGKGLAYIDDFEGARMFIPMQTAYSVWRLAAVPAALPNSLLVDPQQLQNHRAKLMWYNVPVSSFSNRSVVVTDIWPNRKAAREDQRVTVLDLEYHPTTRGGFNYTPDLADPRQSWAGIQRLLPVNATNLVDGNYNYLEIWMKVENPSRGKMLIDLGKISEDVIPNQVLNTEDAVVFGMNGRNGILNPGEDVGLDMLTNDEEKITYANEIAMYNLGDDPSDDNYAYNSSEWSKFNGTEGNLNDPAGVFPDTEDMNNNGILDLTNEYFEYEIDLDTTLFNPSDASLRNKYIVGGGSNGWYQFRIPLTEFTRKIGNPALENVEFIRVLLNGIETNATVRIADFNFVGNQWLERLRNDPYFQVSVVNIEDNPEYSTPPGVIRPRDRTRPDQEVYGNEQSLSLRFINLPDTTYREAYRLFPGQGMDLFNYEYLRMYVHGEETMNYKAEFVTRIGIDTLNFYEYRQPLSAGWSDVSIRFTDLTGIKAQRDSAASELDSIPVLDGPPGAYFRIKGNPDVIRVQFISTGIRNVGNNRSISGAVWVNEMRLVSPKNKAGYAYTGSAQLRLADIADVSASVSHTDPYFHGISERFSSTRSTTTAWNVNTTLNVDRVFPKDWQGTSIRVAYSHSENYVRPMLLPGQPDVEVEGSLRALEAKMIKQGRSRREIEAAVAKARVATQTLEVRDSWAIPSVKFKVPGESWLATYLVNRLDLSYNYTVTRYRDPVFEGRRNWQWTARVGYGFDFPREAYVQPFRFLSGIPILDAYKDVKYYYLPTRISFAGDLSRSRIEEKQRALETSNPFVRTFSHTRSGNLAYVLSEGGLFNISTTYSSTLGTSLLGLEIEPERDKNGQIILDPTGYPIMIQRQSSAVFDDIFFGRNGGLYFGVPSTYTQQVSVNSRPSIPKIFDLDRYLDLNLVYNVTYNWQANLQQGAFGRSASYNASVNSQLNFKLKQLFDPLFPETTNPAPQQPKPSGGRPTRTQRPAPQRIPAKDMEAMNAKKEEMNQKNEALATMLSDPNANPTDVAKIKLEVENLRKSLEQLERAASKNAVPDTTATEMDTTAGRSVTFSDVLRNIAYWGLRVPFLEYENLAFQFSQNTTSNVTGVRGETGFNAFWSTPPFSGPSDADMGPVRLYQLGLITDPNPRTGTPGFTGSFPFIDIRNYQRGLRAANPNGAYVDNFQQSNTVSLRTSRPLWEGARLDINWDLRWTMNKNTQLLTDTLGVQTITGVTATGTIERSYLIMPDFLFFKYFDTNVDAVAKRYQEFQANPLDVRDNSEKLSQAFEEGFEAVPWLSKVLRELMPRMNWGIRWDGIEKLPFMGWADRISFEHRYTSSMATGYRINNDNGSRVTETKRAQYGFSPLIGLTFGFNQIWGGTMNITTRWASQKSFDLNTSSTNISESSTDEVSMNASFKKQGFDFPLFGLTLKNDIDFSLSFSLNKTSSHTYDINNLASGGQPREGTTRITIEPRVRYNISTRVTSSLFYRYSRTKPDASVGSRIPGTTIHEAGLELRISISGS